ncbi:hypothetical protein PFISCL1PPCAC_16812, partial [Pristionchus fissidentatus]
SPPFSPLPPPPPVVQQLQQLQQAEAGLTRVNTQEVRSMRARDCRLFGMRLAKLGQESLSSLSAAGSGRSFLDDISKGNFALRKTSADKSPTGSLQSETTSGDDDMEQDENVRRDTVGPLVKPTTRQLLSRKTSLRRISVDRSPGGTPQNRGRRRAPSLGQDGGVTLFQGEYLAAALANKFKTNLVNEEDDDQSV